MTDFRALCAELLAATDEYTGMNPYMRLDTAMKAARAALAQPEPQGPTDEEAVALYSEVMAVHECQTLGDMAGHFARAVLARWGRPAIELVPVSERLPGPENCDAEGRCWGLTSTPHLDGCCYKTWKLVPCSWVGPGNTSTHWLPHWALPFPKVNNTGKTND